MEKMNKELNLNDEEMKQLLDEIEADNWNSSIEAHDFY